MLHLLSETDTGSGIERKEDERVWHKVLSNTVVEETVRVELLRWERNRVRCTPRHSVMSISDIPVGHQ